MTTKVLFPHHLHRDHENIRNRYIQQPLGRMTGISLQCLRKDGAEFPCDISVHQQAEQALSDSQQRLREMAAQNEATREEERKHIAREVHDELGQVLTAG